MAVSRLGAAVRPTTPVRDKPDAEVTAAALHRAISRDEIVVLYQPQVDLKTGAIVGAEALVRWDHPSQGMLGPGAFLPSAERSGAIVQVDDYVVQRACQQLRTWQLQGATGFRMAVNMSIRSLESPSLPRRIAQALSDAAISAGQLEIEVTESANLLDGAKVVSALSGLREAGVSVALDDFGTGYATLDRLRSLPFDALKIDRSFVAGLETPYGPQMLMAAVRLGQGLGLRVVAEGVENGVQLAFLTEQSCDEAQGYLLGRPMSSAELVARLNERPPMPRADVRNIPHAFGTDDAALERLVRPLLSEVARLTELESTYLTYIDRGSGEQLVMYGRNEGALDVAEGARIPWDDTVCKRSMESGICITNDVPAVFGDSAAAQALGLRSYAGVPVAGGSGEAWGTLCGASMEQRSLDKTTVSVLQAFSRLISSQLDLIGWQPPGRSA